MNAWRFVVSCFAAAILTSALPAAAQDYPSREIRVYCGFPAGSGADITVRFFADRLAALAGKPTIVENRPGAFANIATEAVARARPDGYHLLITPAAPIASNVHLFNKLPYDPVKDFTPVTTLARQGLVLVVNPKLPLNSVSDLTAHVKARAGKASYGAAGPLNFAAAELYKSIIGADVATVNYQAGPQAYSELMDGALDFIFVDNALAIEQIKSGRGRALAVTTVDRLAAMPDVPTMQQAGVAGYEIMGWWSAMFPAGTPDPIVSRVAGWMNQVVAAEETEKFLLRIGLEPFRGNAALVSKQQAVDLVKWGELYAKARVPKI